MSISFSYSLDNSLFDVCIDISVISADITRYQTQGDRHE